MVKKSDEPTAWTPARLIPVSGIRNAAEAETRATSALLAVLTAVEEFGREIIKVLGGPVGQVRAFTEVQFVSDGKKVIPDGLIRVTRGKKQWTILVEVKTGSNDLKADQLTSYLELAKHERFDGVLTISNQIVAVPGQHPTASEMDKRKLKSSVALHHLSWSRILAIALTVKKHTGVSDPDQAWILGELIRYLEYPKSGAAGFESMGSAWVAVKDSARDGTLRANSEDVKKVAGLYDALLRYIGLRLGQSLGEEVNLQISRKELADPQLRHHAVVERLVDTSVLAGALAIPDTVGPLVVECDLRARQITCSTTLKAPEAGRNRTRVNWIVRQLKNAPEDTRIEAQFKRMRTGTAQLLGQIREDPDLLTAGMDDKELSSFTVARTFKMGLNRDVGKGSFISTVHGAVDDYYAEILQMLKRWTPPAPKLPKESPILDIEQSEAESQRTVAG